VLEIPNTDCDFSSFFLNGETSSCKVTDNRYLGYITKSQHPLTRPLAATHWVLDPTDKPGA